MKIKLFEDFEPYTGEWYDDFGELEFKPPSDYKMDLEDWVKNYYYREATIYIEEKGDKEIDLEPQIVKYCFFNTFETDNYDLYNTPIPAIPSELEGAENISDTYVGKKIIEFIKKYEDQKNEEINIWVVDVADTENYAEQMNKYNL